MSSAIISDGTSRIYSIAISTDSEGEEGIYRSIDAGSVRLALFAPRCPDSAGNTGIQDASARPLH